MIVDQSNRNRVQPEAIHTNKNQSSSIRDNGINPAEHSPLRAETSLGNGINPTGSIPIHKQDLASKNSPIGVNEKMNNIGRKTRNPDHVNKIHQKISPPANSPAGIIFLLFSIVAAIFGYDSYGGGGSGWGGGWGSNIYIDWTVFFAIAAAVIGAIGLTLTIGSKSSIGVYALLGMMEFFTLIGSIFGTIGLIKSIRDYYDVGIYLSLGAFALLAIMWIVGLI